MVTPCFSRIGAVDLMMSFCASVRGGTSGTLYSSWIEFGSHRWAGSGKGMPLYRVNKGMGNKYMRYTYELKGHPVDPASF